METKNNDHRVQFKWQGATIHQLAKQSRKKLGQGQCIIYQQDQNVMLQVKYYTKNIRKVKFGKMQYRSSVSFFIHESNPQNYIQVLSLSKQSNKLQKICEFEDKLKQYGYVTDLITENADTQILEVLQYAYPDWSKKEVQNQSAISKISKQFGGFMGSISGIISKPLQTVGKTVDDKKQSVYRDSVGSQTKGKWQNVKEKAGKLNQSLAETLKPVSDGAKNLTSNIGHNFNHSNNSVIKAIRDFGINTKNALNQGYNQGMGEKQVKKEYKTETNTKLDEGNSKA